jgi:sulfite reductase beta subunit-like hemoprotein
VAVGSDPSPVGTPVTFRINRAQDPYQQWESANVVVGVAKGTVSAIAYARLGDVTSEQFRGLAAIVRDFGLTVRITNRQNFALRDLSSEQLPDLYRRLDEIGMAEPGAELARDVVACPGADTCNLAVTQSRGLAADIGRALEEAGLAEVGGIRINISGCTNSCGQHHIADIGFFGAERRAHGRPAPGYQLLLGGHVGDTEIEFGHKALRLPAKAAAEATVRLVGRYADERSVGEAFSGWMERVGGAKVLATELKDLDEWPDPDERPDYYIDFDETGPYVAEVGEGECAAS